MVFVHVHVLVLEELMSTCNSIHLQAVVRCAEDSGVEAAFELIQEYFASEKVFMVCLTNCSF